MRLNYILLLLLTILNVGDYITTVEIVGNNPTEELNPVTAYLIATWGVHSIMWMKTAGILIWLPLLPFVPHTLKWPTWGLIILNVAYGIVFFRSLFVILMN